MDSPVICHALEWVGMHRHRQWPAPVIYQRQSYTDKAKNYYKHGGQFSSLVFSHSGEL